jgi:predicted N-acetyltransferase YhbS
VPVAYSLEPDLSPDEYIDLMHRSTLAERRPVDRRDRIAAMIAGADIVACARSKDGLLVGISRALTDFSYATYLADLAVDTRWQSQGIGRELIRRTHEAAGQATRLILLAAPKARSYYPHIGMEPHDSCWFFAPRTSEWPTPAQRLPKDDSRDSASEPP